MPYSKISFLLSIAAAAAANRAAYRVVLYNAFGREVYRRGGAVVRAALYVSEAVLFVSEAIAYSLQYLEAIWPFPPEEATPFFWGPVILVEAYMLHKIITGLRAVLAS